MNSLENMKKRLENSGGINQQKRMIEDKLKSLKKSLLYSYQAETLILEDGRNFRCLINPSKIKDEYDNKTLSVPFEDICLAKTILENEQEKDVLKKPEGKTTNSFEKIPLQQGSVFKWKETNTFWLVHLQHLEELAYFRAEIKKCNKEILIGDKTYHVYVRGSSVTNIDWTSRRSAFTWNDLNYDLLMLITNDKESNDFCHRFGIIYIDNLPYQIEAIDNISTEGIIQVALKEYYKNTIQLKEQERINEIENNKEENLVEYKIIGPEEVYPYDTVTYKVEGLENGEWFIDNSKIIIKNQDSTNISVFISATKKGNFKITYKNIENEINLNVKINSL